MRLAARTARRIARVMWLVCICALSLAAIWTAHQFALGALEQRDHALELEARRGAYQATGTALAPADDEAKASGQSGIVLMQQVFETATPAPKAASQAAGTPEPLDLPRLVLPRNPSAGLELAGTRVPSRATTVPREYDLVNIVLLGADDELTSDNFIRTDTMIIVSLNRETGSVSMVNLPRDLFVYIPSGRMGRLNIAYGIGENIDWQPDGGFGLLRQTIFYNFGINVHYYARVNFTGFTTIIDRLGGVDIAVDCRYRDLYPVSRMEDYAGAKTDFDMRTLEIGYYTFDGYDALWYARTRRLTDDLDRGRRQQQLLRGMWRKARESGLLTTVPALWNDIAAIVDTNLPLDTVLSLLPQLVALDLDSVQNFTFKRRYHTVNWQTPRGDHVLLPVADVVAELMRDFYTPPAPHQADLTSLSIAVYNGSGNENWDLVASERLRWDGYNAIAMGALENGEVMASSRLIDRVAASKGSLTPRLIKALNLERTQVETAADPAREFDYEFIIGADYDSCTYGVLPIRL